ncbi:MAG: nucleotidyltransferase family protein [Actinobacteria bacterium]|nr:MAG: nucleotidyltransferase family protein [Actinomycetota bacterium]
MIIGLVLAAGESTRMGDVKQLLPYRGTTVLGAVIEAASASMLGEILVVTGYHGAAVEGLVPDGIRIVRNPDPARGNHSSLLLGLAGAKHAEAVLMLLGDQPEVDAAVIDRLVEVWQEERPWAAVAEYRGEPGHPFLLSAECAAAVPAWTGPRPLWHHLVEDPDGKVVRVAFDRRAPIDVDTPDDYARLIG